MTSSSDNNVVPPSSSPPQYSPSLLLSSIKPRRQSLNLLNLKKIDIYTDGACPGNQFKTAKAGVGVYFGDNDPRNISERLQGSQQTNNRAELTALIRAIETGGAQAELTIYTDSQYCKNGIEKWIKNWKKNGWKTAKKQPVKNQDLWIKLDDLMQTHHVLFKWIKGHSGNHGNDAADALAVAGCQKPLIK